MPHPIVSGRVDASSVSFIGMGGMRWSMSIIGLQTIRAHMRQCTVRGV